MFTVTSSSASLCFSGRGGTLLILHTPAERRIDSMCQLAAAAERVVSTAVVVTIIVHVTGVTLRLLHHHRGVFGQTNQLIDFIGAFWVPKEINRLVLSRNEESQVNSRILPGTTVSFLLIIIFLLLPLFPLSCSSSSISSASSSSFNVH